MVLHKSLTIGLKLLRMPTLTWNIWSPNIWYNKKPTLNTIQKQCIPKHREVLLPTNQQGSLSSEETESFHLYRHKQNASILNTYLHNAKE